MPQDETPEYSTVDWNVTKLIGVFLHVAWKNLFCRNTIMAMETSSRLKGQKEPKLSIDDVLNNNFRYWTWSVTKSWGNLESSNVASSKE